MSRRKLVSGYWFEFTKAGPGWGFASEERVNGRQIEAWSRGSISDAVDEARQMVAEAATWPAKAVSQ